MLNEYLNRYAEKLSRGNAMDPFEIKVDFEKYDDILSQMESATYNPYFIYIDRKKDQKSYDINGSESEENQGGVKSRYLDHFKDEKEELKK